MSGGRSEPSCDLTILTDSRYVDPRERDPYVENILYEEELVRRALEAKGMTVERASWDDPGRDWSRSAYLLFRSTWDYFDRFGEFSSWLEKTRKVTAMLNPYRLIRWNLDKHYLADLAALGVAIPPTLYIEKGDTRSLAQWMGSAGWKEAILKPVVSGAARHTYRFRRDEAVRMEELFRSLVGAESMMLQEFQERVLSDGEVAFMLFGGVYSHAVLKRAKPGDFRVQDDFGGTVHLYHPPKEEIAFARQVVEACDFPPVYARVDAIRDNRGALVLSELELIEPELWFRLAPGSADSLARAVLDHIRHV